VVETMILFLFLSGVLLMLSHVFLPMMTVELDVTDLKKRVSLLIVNGSAF
jgi:hypothetical protein